jgi:GGDEF domain-containing protein
MQSVLMAAAQAVALDSPYDSVFVPLVDDLVDALAGDDPDTFFTAVEGRARLLAGERSLRMADVFLGLQLGLDAFRRALGGAQPGATSAVALATQRLERLEGESLLRAGVGFAEGLEEAAEQLRRAVVALAATDPATGLTNAAEVERRLTVELERCRRTEVGLGACLVAIVTDADEHRGSPADLSDLAGSAARSLSAGLRRYDVIGSLSDREFVAVLPDVSRRGVQAVLERLRRSLVGECSPRHRLVFRFVATYLDVVDVGAADLMAVLGRGMDEARRGAETVVWV